MSLNLFPPNLGVSVYLSKIMGLGVSEPRQPGLEEKSSQSIPSALEAIKGYVTPTNVLLGVCIATHAVSLLDPDMHDEWLKIGSFSLPKILEGEIWRVATGALLHADLVHLGFNMFCLSKIGPRIEKIWGAKGVPQIAAMSIGAQILFSSIYPQAPGVGLSGVLCGMKGAITANEFKKSKSKESEVVSEVISFLVYQYLFTEAMSSIGVNIGLAAHITGFVGGMTFGWLANENSPTVKLPDTRTAVQQRASVPS